MAKGFRMPSISQISNVKIPSVSGISNIPEVKSLGDKITSSLPDITKDIPELGTVKSSLGGMGISSSSDVKKLIADEKPKEFKLPTPADMKSSLKSKYDGAKNTYANYKKEGVKGLIPQDLKDLKTNMDDAGIPLPTGADIKSTLKFSLGNKKG